MSIRVKFLVVLLVATLVPTAFAAVLAFVSTAGVARSIATDQRASLLREAEGVLRAVMEKNVGIFTQETSTYVTAARVQIDATERALRDDSPPVMPRFEPSAFREGGRVPALERSDRRVVLSEDGPDEPALISFAFPAIYVAEGGSAEDADRLMQITTTLRAMSQSMARSAFWQFVTLDSGVHLVYPGHGLFPDAHDGRLDPVFQRARSRVGAGFGSPPSVDPATGQTLVGLVMPVSDENGETIGLSGVLSPVGAILDGLRFGTEWGVEAENMFVVLQREIASGEVKPFIIARQSYAETQEGQRGFLGIDEFRLDDAADTAVVLEALRSADSGTMLTTVDGEGMLCAYAGLPGDSIGLVTLVPTSSIGAIADQAGERIRARAVTQVIGIIIGVGFFSAGMVLAAFIGARAITTPIASLAGAIRRVAAGDLDVRADVQTRDEVGELAQAFNGMVPRLRDHLRLRDSLDLAQQVQRKLLPASPPDVEGFDVAARSLYCDETGGDYFDFLEFDQPGPGRLTVAVGDVTGHGVAAALLMATARALIRMRSALPGAMADRLADINRHLAGDADTGRFMTLMLLSLDRERGEATWVGAGHDPVLVYDPAQDEFTELEGEDIPLAVDPAWRFTERSERVVEPGRVLFLGTDGIWEAFDGRDEQYGKSRLRACLRAHASRPAGEIAGAIVEDVAAFRGDRAQHDDVTLVVIRVV